MGVSLNISLTGSQTLVRLDARHPSRGLDVNADLDLVRSPLPPRALRSAARCARAIARERLLGAARFGPSREARSRVFRDGDHGRAAGGARRRVPLSTPLSTLSRSPSSSDARARSHPTARPPRASPPRALGRFSRAFSPISPRSTPTPAHLPPSLAQAFKSFVANASAPSTSWRLSRLENGLRIFEEDASGDGVASPDPAPARPRQIDRRPSPRPPPSGVSPSA